MSLEIVAGLEDNGREQHQNENIEEVLLNLIDVSLVSEDVVQDDPRNYPNDGGQTCLL